MPAENTIAATEAACRKSSRGSTDAVPAKPCASATVAGRKRKRAAPTTPRDIVEAIDGLDPAFLAAAAAELGPAPDLRKGHYVVDPGMLRAEVGQGDPSEDEPTSIEEGARLRRLLRYAADSDLLYKRHLVADAALIERLVALKSAVPNARAVLDIVIGAARVSALAGAPLDLPPLLIVGPPGCGKSFMVRELGRALAVPVLGLLGSTMSDASAITGTAVGWRGAAPSALADLLLQAPTSGPVVFLDEIEKWRVFDRRDAPADVLLGVLDKTMAAAHQDLYYRVPMRADRATFLFAANTSTGLSAPLLDRVIVVELAPPRRDERRAIVHRIHADVRRRLGLGPAADLDGSIVDELGDMSLRRSAPALQLAFGRAAEAGRSRLHREDIAWARRQVEHGYEPARQRIGFLRDSG